MVVGTSWPMASKTRAVMEREIGKRIGENVAIYRRSRGLSQVVLAGLVGRTESWLSQIERGVLRVDRLSVLVELARVLKVEVGDLLGGPPLLKSASGGGYEGLPALRHALLRPDPVAGILEPAAGDEPRALAALQADVAHTWGLLHTCRYAALAAILPGLLAEFQSATQAFEADDRVAAFRLLAELYHVISGLMKKLGEADLSWVAAERAIAAAERADDPLLTIAGAWHLTGVLLGSGRPREASDVARATADRVTSDDVDTPERLSLLGVLLLDAATASALQDDRAGAGELLDSAEAVARRLGADRNDCWTLFGPAAVAIQAVTVAVELGDGTVALERTRVVDPAPFPSLARRTQHLIDVARAHSQLGRDAAAAVILLQAGRFGPEEVRYQPLARDLLRYLLQRDSPILHAELRALAEQIGMLG